jgi:AraC-like DNA-binding protein
LPTPVNHSFGIRIGDGVKLPDSLLVFERCGIHSSRKTNIHHRFLLSVNVGEPCDLILDGTRFTILQGQAVLVYPCQHHLFIHDQSGIARFMVSFEIELTSPMLPPRNRIFSIGPEEESIISMLVKSYLEEQDILSCSLLTSILLMTFQRQPPLNVKIPPVNQHTRFIDEVILFIQRRLEKSLNIHLLARQFNISTSHLRLRFRQSLGISLGQYLSDTRINRAMSYLCECDLNVKEVATKCGYKSIYSFGHTFKKRVGISPVKYRKSCRITGKFRA